MARLQEGERKNRRQRVFLLLQRYRWGLREVEIATEFGWERRTVNNYLRELAGDNKAYRDGRLWFATRLRK